MAKKGKNAKNKKPKWEAVNTQLTLSSTLDLKTNETDGNLTIEDITVPPPTPSSQFGLEINFQALPTKLPNVENLKIPEVRRNGVKLCIDTLADYFQCQDYKFNHFQFWFLDVVTDCLWKAQDEFRFPDQLQKVVLSWILFIFDKMRDQQEDITRKKLFTIFKESILMGAEYVDEGGKLLPPPEQLFVLTSARSSESSSVVTSSLSVHSSEKDADSAIFFNEKNKAQRFTLKKEACQCHQYDVSSIDSRTESGFTTCSETSNQEEDDVIKSGSECSLEDLIIGGAGDAEYLVEDLEGKFQVVSAPSSLTISEESNCESNVLIRSRIESLDSRKVSSFNTSTIASPETSGKSDTSFDSSSYNTKMRILTKYLTNVNLSEQKAAAMDDPEKGWVSSNEDSEKASEAEEAGDDSEWVDILDKYENDIGSTEDTAFINFGVLWAIIDFVFDYFYESFQFTLIKLAFREVPNIICQKINQEWKTPKVPKGEFIPPPSNKPKAGKKEKKGKKEKIKLKDEKDKKGKDSKKPRKSSKASEASIKSKKGGKGSQGSIKGKKGGKGSQGSIKGKKGGKGSQGSIKDKKGGKGSQGSLKGKKSKTGSKESSDGKKGAKKSKDKKDKKGKEKKKRGKEKEDKGPKLTKEEREELEMVRQEQERLEEERRKREEDKRLMFPLNDAVDDDLFHRIFEGWVKVDIPTGDGEKKKKKAKKGKSK